MTNELHLSNVLLAIDSTTETIIKNKTDPAISSTQIVRNIEVTYLIAAAESALSSRL